MTVYSLPPIFNKYDKLFNKYPLEMYLLTKFHIWKGHRRFSIVKRRVYPLPDFQ